MTLNVFYWPHSELADCSSVTVRVHDRFPGSERLSPAWTLHKDDRVAICQVWSHILGFALRLKITDDPLTRTHVCTSYEELVSRQDEWMRALLERGWVKRSPSASPGPLDSDPRFQSVVRRVGLNR